MLNNVKNSEDVFSSRVVDYSRYVDSSRYVYSSCYVDSSYDVYASRDVDMCKDCLFCYEIKQKEYYVFNKQVSEERFKVIRNLWLRIKGDFTLELKDNEWEDEWKKFPKEKWIELSKIPEFDKEVVEKIIGFDLDLEEPNKEDRYCSKCGTVIKKPMEEILNELI